MNRINKILLGIFFIHLVQIQLADCISCFSCRREMRSSSPQQPAQPADPLLNLVCKIHECVRRRLNQRRTIPFRYDKNDLRERIYYSSKEFTSMYQRYAEEMHGDIDAPLDALFKAIDTKLDDFAKRAGKPDINTSPAIRLEAVPFIYYLSKKLKEDEPKSNDKKPGTEYDRQEIIKYTYRFVQVMKDRDELLKIRIRAEKAEDLETAQAGDSKEGAKGKHKSIGTETPKAEGSSSASDRLPPSLIADLATEFCPVDIEITNHFIRIANKQFKKVSPSEMVEIKLGKNKRIVETGKIQPRPIDEDDVQILFTGGQESRRDMRGHTVCGLYSKADHKLHIYDSDLTGQLSSNQMNLVAKLYPHISNEIPIFEHLEDDMVQRDEHSCALHAIAYATSFLFDRNPKDVLYKLNDVVGDDALYLRLHLLNILMKQEITPFPEFD